MTSRLILYRKTAATRRLPIERALKNDVKSIYLQLTNSNILLPRVSLSRGKELLLIHTYHTKTETGLPLACYFQRNNVWLRAQTAQMVPKMRTISTCPTHTQYSAVARRRHAPSNSGNYCRNRSLWILYCSSYITTGLLPSLPVISSSRTARNSQQLL